MSNYEMTFEQDVIDRLARIEERMSAGVVMDSDHEDRIRVVEKRQWWLAGVIGAVGALGSTFLHSLALPFLSK